MESFKVSTRLDLNDMVGPRIAELIRELDRLDRKTEQVNRRMKSFGGDTAGIRQSTAAIRAMYRDIDRAQQNMARMGINVPVTEIRSGASAIGRMDRNLLSASRSAEKLTAHLHSVASAAHAIPGIRVATGGGAGGGRTAGGAGGLHGGNVHVGQGGFGVGSIGLGIGPAAGGTMIAGYLGFRAIEGSFDAARDYQTAFMRFKALNLGDAVNAEADAYVKATQHFAVSNTEMMRVLAESVGLFGDFSEAKKFAPRIAELAVANGAIYGDKLGNLDEAGIGSLLKFIDRRGGFKDDASFQRNLNLAEQLVTGSGGRIKFSDLDQVSQRGGTAFRGLSDQGVRNLAGLIIEQGGSAAGVALMSFYQNLVAGRTTKKAMVELQEMGIGKMQMQTHGLVGGKPYRSLVMTNIKDEELLRTNVVSWVHDVLLPKVLDYEKAKGLPQTDDMTAKLINDILSNRTASNQGTIIEAQHVQLMRDANLNANSVDAKQALDLYKQSPAAAQERFNKAWTDFSTAFGDKILPSSTDLLNAGTGLLKEATSFLNHPFDSALRWIKQYQGEGQGMNPYDELPRQGNGVRSMQSPIAAPQLPSITLHGYTYLDGRKIAETVSLHQAKALGSRMGSGGYDFSSGLPAVGTK